MSFFIMADQNKNVTENAVCRKNTQLLGMFFFLFQSECERQLKSN